MQDDKLVTDVTDSALGKMVENKNENENENEDGVTYSADGKVLENAPYGLKTCVVRPGTEGIRGWAFLYYHDVLDQLCVDDNEHLEEVVLPNTLKWIGDSAFDSCRCLKAVELPDLVTVIEDYTFARCSGLTEIVIPKSVTEIGEDAFVGCSGLEKIVVEDGNPRYDSRDDCNAIIDSEKNELILGCKNTIIPDTVTKIGRYAFSGCTGLSKVDIPDTVTKIGFDAFGDCSGLEKIVVEDGNPRYDSRDDCNAIIDSEKNELILGCKNTAIPDTVTKIGDYAFRGCTGLTEIEIPNSVTKIGDWSFRGCTGLVKINIPDSVTEIGDLAFHGCTSLTEMKMPKSVTKIGDEASDGCTGLAGIDNHSSVAVVNSMDDLPF